MVSVSFTDTLAFDTKYRFRYCWISNIDTSIGIAETQTPILGSICFGIAEAQTPILVLVSLKKYGIAHLCLIYTIQLGMTLSTLSGATQVAENML